MRYASAANGVWCDWLIRRRYVDGIVGAYPEGIAAATSRMRRRRIGEARAYRLHADSRAPSKKLAICDEASYGEVRRLGAWPQMQGGSRDV